MKLRLERCDRTLFTYDAQRWDDTTRGWVWAARVVYDEGVEVVRGYLNAEELDAIARRATTLLRSVWEVNVEVHE